MAGKTQSIESTPDPHVLSVVQPAPAPHVLSVVRPTPDPCVLSAFSSSVPALPPGRPPSFPALSLLCPRAVRPSFPALSLLCPWAVCPSFPALSLLFPRAVRRVSQLCPYSAPGLSAQVFLALSLLCPGPSAHPLLFRLGRKHHLPFRLGRSHHLLFRLGLRLHSHHLFRLGRRLCSHHLFRLGFSHVLFCLCLSHALFRLRLGFSHSLFRLGFSHALSLSLLGHSPKTLSLSLYNGSYILKGTPSTICVLLFIFLGSLSVVTICGNLLVIISIIYFKQLHTATNFLILSLAVADLLVGLVVFPLSMVFSLSSCLYYEDLFCKVRDSLDATLSVSSILNTCCISIDRYYAVCQPLNYRTKINVNVVAVMIVVSWSVSVLVAIGRAIPGLISEKCKENCVIDFRRARILAQFFSFYLPVIIMLCIYLKIFLVAQRQARSIQNTTCQNTKSGATASKMERKSTKTLAIVMGVFLMCWTPFFLYVSCQVLNHVPMWVPLFETLNWLTLSNSMFNPFIYAFFYSWFRSALRMIISGKIFQGDFTNTKLL
ncbi:trace amine-associated receptor 1-like [Sebastes fasciatus]|uniref:trace amine-associated receptor 1-like n=1 Tax=Sebastes fasciatus TaxID=394691 RepID=UPI003D9F8382